MATFLKNTLKKKGTKDYKILQIHSVKLEDTAVYKGFIRKMQHKLGISE